jgi:hypothetical protein
MFYLIEILEPGKQNKHLVFDRMQLNLFLVSNSNTDMSFKSSDSKHTKNEFLNSKIRPKLTKLLIFEFSNVFLLNFESP